MSAFWRTRASRTAVIGQLVGGEPVGLHPDVDRAVEPAHEPHLAHPERALELDLDDLVGQLGQLAQRPVAGHRHREGGRLVVVELRDDGRLRVAGEVPDREGDLLADVLGRHVDVPAQLELHDDDGLAGAGDRAQLADALHGVDHLLDLARDLALHLLGGGAAELGADAHGGQVHGGEAVHAEAGVGGGADHDEGEHEHGREHRPADADLGELLHASRAGPPPVARRSGCRAARPPGCPPGCRITTSTRSPRRRPVVTRTSTARPLSTVSTFSTPAKVTIAVVGHGDHAEIAREDDVGLGEGAGPEHRALVGHLGLHQERAVLLADGGRDAGDAPAVLAGHALDGHDDRLPHPHRRSPRARARRAGAAGGAA